MCSVCGTCRPAARARACTPTRRRAPSRSRPRVVGLHETETIRFASIFARRRRVLPESPALCGSTTTTSGVQVVDVLLARELRVLTREPVEAHVYDLYSGRCRRRPAQ